MHRLTLLTVTLAAAVLTACGSEEPVPEKNEAAEPGTEAAADEEEGGSDEGEEDDHEGQETEQDELTDAEISERSSAAREVTEDFFEALLAHDGETACDLMTETAQNLYGLFAVTEDEEAIGDCPLGFALAAQENVGDPVTGASNISGGEVDISPDGSTAQVEVTYPGVDDDQPDLALAWEEDEWKVEAPFMAD
jgi:hypothetical protein